MIRALGGSSGIQFMGFKRLKFDRVSFRSHSRINELSSKFHVTIVIYTGLGDDKYRVTGVSSSPAGTKG